MTMEQLYQFAVAHPRFKLSKTRAKIMNGLWVVVARFCQWSVSVDLWIDGSFLTEKIDPKDVDLVVVLEADFLDHATPEQQAVMEWLCEDTAQQAKDVLFCDAYALYKTAPADPGYSDYLVQDAYWKRQFGISRQKQEKGMVLVSIRNGIA